MAARVRCRLRVLLSFAYVPQGGRPGGLPEARPAQGPSAARWRDALDALLAPGEFQPLQQFRHRVQRHTRYSTRARFGAALLTHLLCGPGPCSAVRCAGHGSAAYPWLPERAWVTAAPVKPRAAPPHRDASQWLQCRQASGRGPLAVASSPLPDRVCPRATLGHSLCRRGSVHSAAAARAPLGQGPWPALSRRSLSVHKSPR